MCLVAVSCQISFQITLGVGHPGYCVYGTNTCDYFLWGYLKDCVYCTNTHSQKLHAKIEAVAEEVVGDMLCYTVGNFVVCLQQVHELEGSHIEHVRE